MAKSIGRISTQDCLFHKDRKVLETYSENFGGGFPDIIEIKSHVTNKVVNFVPISDDDPNYDEDNWDGEMQLYAPLKPQDRVSYLIVRHAY